MSLSSRLHPGRRHAVLLALACATALPAMGAEQDLGAVRREAERFVQAETATLGGDVSVRVQGPDPQLHLAACARLEAFLPTGAKLWGRATVGVRCATPGGWSLTLPVTVKVMGTAVFTARPLARDQVLAPADVTARPADLTQLPPAVITDPAQAVGRRAGTGLAAGLVLRRDMLRGERLVSAGQTVTLEYRAGGLHVTGEGRALAHGEEGDEVSVRTAAGKVVRGRVIGAGMVRVQ